MTKLVSIIIPHLKGFSILDECVTSINQNIKKIDYEIIIVNNNSKDNSIKNIKNKFPEVKIIHSKINKGYAGGCNLGAKNSSGKYLFFLNNDTVITKNSVELLVDELEKNQNISSVQPKIKNYYNKKLFDYAGACGGYIDYLGYPFSRGRIFNTIEKDIGQYEDKKKIFWASGTAFLTRQKVFQEIGGFDEQLFAHMEEIDYHWKCLLEKYDIYIIPESIIYHKGGKTLQYGSFKKIYLNHRNSIILFLSNHQNLSINMIFKRMILEKLAALNYLFTGKLSAFFAIYKANLWILIHLNYIIKRRRKIKTNHIISEDLMAPYSIVKQYFKNRKTTYNQLN